MILNKRYYTTQPQATQGITEDFPVMLIVIFSVWKRHCPTSDSRQDVCNCRLECKFNHLKFGWQFSSQTNPASALFKVIVNPVISSQKVLKREELVNNFLPQKNGGLIEDLR